MGYTETDAAGNKSEVAGLKQELEDSYSDLITKINNFTNEITSVKESTVKAYVEFLSEKNIDYDAKVDQWNARYDFINDKITKLLPMALTTGLSYAYTEKKAHEENDLKALNSKFNYSIWGLVGISIIPFIVSLVSLFNGKTLEETILTMPRLVLAILPLYIPVMWVAYSSSKKMNLSKRLIEEYSHKEVLSKTFEGLSRQIDDIDDEDISSALRNKLLYNILEVSSENPGKLISDYNKADHPLMDALDKSVQLANAVEKLSKIPGMSKITDIISKQRTKILEEQSDKAQKGLNAVDAEK